MADLDILVTRSSMPALDEYVSEIAPLWESHWLTNQGTKHRQLEKELHSYLGVDNVSLFVNGHSALECVLETFELGSDGRDEVITTPFTFASTTHAIVRKGLRPVFCDIRPTDYTIDPDKIEDLVTEKTCAIVPVHVYGNVCNDEKIEAVAKKHNLKVIYDAAHAFGVEKNGVPVGRFGDASMFSFHATKVFNTIEGGCICYSDPALTERLSQWRNFGITGPESVEFVGGNAKMNEFCAAMGICNLRHVDEEIAKRKVVGEKYFELLADVPGLSLCVPPENIKHNYSYMPVVVDPDVFGATRDDIFDALAEQGIGARKYFYPLTNSFECYEGVFDPGMTPIAQRIANEVITLPMYADLSLEDVERICRIVLERGRK